MYLFSHFSYNGQIILLQQSTHHPPPIVGMEVSARWKRTWKGEVIMTIVMPENVIDTEVYVKTSKEHIGLQMDPWISCSWKRT